LLSEFSQASLGNMLIVGPRGVGKATLLQVLLASTVESQRTVVVESSGEFAIIYPSIKSLRTVSADHDFGEILGHLSAQRVAIADAPERAGALHVQAVEAGYNGTICCINAGSARAGLMKIVDGLSRVSSISSGLLLERVSSAISLVVVLELDHYAPVVKEIFEVLPSDGTEFSLRPLVRLKVSSEGVRTWHLVSQQSLILRKLADRGVVLSDVNGVQVPVAKVAPQVKKGADAIKQAQS